MTSCKELLKACKQVSKALKMLEDSWSVIHTLKDKKVDIVILERCKDYNDYNKWWAYKERLPLTKEEFELLKEVLL